MSTNNNTTYVSKPLKFEGKQGSAYIVWSIKFQSLAGVKGVRVTLNPSFDSRLPAMEETILDKTEPMEKVKAKAILQKCYSYGCYGAVYERNGQLPPCSSKYERRCRLAYQKGMEDMAKHQESLPTHKHNGFKGLYNGYTKDQVEERG
jgi:hypothetical protein